MPTLPVKAKNELDFWKHLLLGSVGSLAKQFES